MSSWRQKQSDCADVEGLGAGIAAAGRCTSVRLWLSPPCAVSAGVAGASAATRSRAYYGPQACREVVKARRAVPAPSSILPSGVGSSWISSVPVPLGVCRHLRL